MDDLRVYVLFNSISVISGRRAVDNERLCAMDPRLRLKRVRLERDSNPGPLALNTLSNRGSLVATGMYTVDTITFSCNTNFLSFCKFRY